MPHSSPGAVSRLVVALVMAAVSLAACSTERRVEPLVGDSGVTLWPQYGDFALEANKAVSPTASFRILGEDESADYLQRIAGTPQARWVGDFTWNDSNTDRTAGVVRAALAQQNIGLLAVAGDPGAECQIEPGPAAAAAAAAAQVYDAFIEAVVAPQAQTPAQMWAILEPGSLPTLDDCDGQGDRIAMMSAGIERLHEAGYAIYVDASGDGRVDPGEMARRLELLPLDAVAGFAVNVGGFRSNDAEAAYAEAIIAALADDGVTGLTYVIDTSRNGVPLDGDDQCNPPSAAIGKAPRLVRQGSLDAYVWVKRPGESDGECNGGTTEGQFSIATAMLLVRNGNPADA